MGSHGDKLNFVSGEKIFLKRLYKLFRGTRSHGLVSLQFLAGLNLFLRGKEKILNDALTEIYHNFLLQALSVKEIGTTLGFEKITELAAEVNLRLQNSIFVNKSSAKKLKT